MCVPPFSVSVSFLFSFPPLNTTKSKTARSVQPPSPPPSSPARTFSMCQRSFTATPISALFWASLVGRVFSKLGPTEFASSLLPSPPTTIVSNKSFKFCVEEFGFVLLLRARTTQGGIDGPHWIRARCFNEPAE